MKILCIYIALIVPASTLLNAQEADPVVSVAELLHEVYDPGEGTGMEELYELLSDLADNPVAINLASEEEISRLFFLTKFQVLSIIDHIKKTGPVVSINELTLIPGIHEATAKLMTPFITLKNGDLKSLKSRITVNKLTLLWSHSGEKSDTSFPGQPWKSTLRYSIRRGMFSAGCIMDKDTYEPVFTKKYPAPDYISGWIAAEPRGIINRIIVGDFAIRSSHGLALNTSSYSSFSLTKPGNLPGNQSVRPYNSADENRFLRGVALSAAKGVFGLTLFASSKKTDATIWYPPGFTDGVVSALYTGGIHNTESLLSKKDALGESTAGTIVTVDAGNTRLSVTCKGTRYSKPFIPMKTGPDSILAFSGSRNDILSAGYTSLAGIFILSGEAAITDRGAWAAVQSIQGRTDDRLSINFFFRYSSPGFHTSAGRLPGVSISSFSGHCIYGGLEFEAARSLFLSAGADLITCHPSSGFTSGRAASRFSSEIKATYSPSSSFSAELTIISRDGLYGNPFDQIAYPSQEGYKTARLKATFSPSVSLKLSARADFKYCKSGSEGFLLYNDLFWNSDRLNLKIWARYSIFNTSGFESAIYAWENDMPFSYNISPLYGTGRRLSLMATTNKAANAKLSLRYSITTTASRSDQSLKAYISVTF